MIKISNLSKSFGENPVIDNLSFELPNCGIVTVTGPSGKGKTTLLNILAGTLKPDSGEIIGDYSSLSYSFQDDRLLPWLSARKNIEIVLPKETQSKAETVSFWLDQVKLADFADYLPDKLSGGMRQRVSLARALAYPSDVVLLDEPFASLDESLHKKMYDIIKEESKNRLIIMVTHDKEDISEINIEI